MVGILLAVVGVLVSSIIWGISKSYLIPGTIGVILIGLSMITSGALVSGDRMRANFATETAQDRKKRNSITFRLALVGLPNLAMAFLIYFLYK